MSDKESQKAAQEEFKKSFLNLMSTPLGRIVLTIVLLFMGPPGWLGIAIIWGVTYFKYKKSKGEKSSEKAEED